MGRIDRANQKKIQEMANEPWSVTKVSELLKRFFARRWMKIKHA